MKLFEVLCLLVVVGVSSAYPKSRSGYYPRSYMVGGSFYANPRYAREGAGYEYLPPGQMTAMVVGDTVATNSFAESPYNPPPAVLTLPEVGQTEEDLAPEQITERQQQPILIPLPEPDSINETEPEEAIEQNEQNINGGQQETLFVEEATTEAAAIPTTKATPIAPTRAPSVARKAGKAKKPVVVPAVSVQPAEEDDDEDSGSAASWPFAVAGRAGIPAYNAFFPIFIGGGSASGRSRTRSTGAQEEAYPGSATAIANSFSTGKGGVATSHATSFGDPYAAAMLRNAGLFNFRTKANRKQQPVQEDEDEE